MSKIEEVIDADSHSRTLLMNRKSAVKVFVPHKDKIIDADAIQRAMFSIKQHVCQDVICV